MDTVKEAKRAEKAIKLALKEIKANKSIKKSTKPLPQVVEASDL